MVPCAPSDAGAKPMGMMELSPEQLIDPSLSAADVEAAAAESRSTVTEADVRRHLMWSEEFGNETK